MPSRQLSHFQLTQSLPSSPQERLRHYDGPAMASTHSGHTRLLSALHA